MGEEADGFLLAHESQAHVPLLGGEVETEEGHVESEQGRKAAEHGDGQGKEEPEEPMDGFLGILSREKEEGGRRRKGEHTGSVWAMNFW